MKVLKFILSMGIVIFLFNIYLGIKANGGSKENQFPHYKQIVMKYEGKIYGKVEEDFEISFHFIDEYLLSEISDKGNIHKINVITEDNEFIELNSWKINSNRFDGYILRNINGKFKYENRSELVLKKMKVIFADNSEEIFDIGNLVIDFKDEKFDNPYIYNSYQDVLIKNGDDNLNFSAVIISLGKIQENKAILKEINLGLESIEIINDIQVINTDISNIDINDLMNKYSVIKLDNENKKEKMDIDLDFVNNENLTLVIPIRKKSQTDDKLSIKVFNPMLTFEINNKSYNLIGDSNIISQPLLVNENEPKKLLLRYKNESNN